MDSSQTPCLTTLLVFENTINKELIRSLHVYRLDNGEENEVEREFVFRKDGPFVETAAAPLLLLQGFPPQELFEGRVIGLWLCFLLFMPIVSLASSSFLLYSPFPEDQKRQVSCLDAHFIIRTRLH
ncbi:hypothetical protein F3Y22_tig00012936pilonHSYRG00026 [Hibiscus syriacus]|uniref:Uncharacterized protein n=1 Tax=Hibiscus syriacus TaxID=106335 RepID=A0A6A3C7Z6_HIBSY|nr:hypothetical protein F3Y22_tig00012936pilonHSYRG00026 [Hibiscus syriacus]